MGVAPRWLAIAALVAGIAAAVCLPVPYLAAPCGAIAVALAVIAGRQPRWKAAAVTGGVIGGVALFISLGVILIALLVGGTINTQF